ncbi:MAG: hypothetical protein IKI74_02595 [Christensenellaceae bacterium]|nr:hypothetical protein [Christensenellaceae bacterium]
MQKEMLLFGFRTGARPYNYQLYFAEKDTVGTADPLIHCCCMKKRKDFLSLEIGGIYLLDLQGVFIRDIMYLDRYHLTEREYFSLCHRRDEMFMTDKEKEHIGFDRDNYREENRYYSLKTSEALYHYEPATRMEIVYTLLKGLEYAACILIPIGLFLLYIFTIGSIKQDSMSRFAPFAVPFAAVTSMPLMFYLMSFIYKLGECLLLNIPEIKYLALRKYFFMWGGIRKSVTFDEINNTRTRVSAAVTFAIFVVGILIISLIK